MNVALLSTLIFIMTVLLIVLRIIDEPVAGLLGSILMIIFIKGFTPEKAFSYIDWDVIGILLGMWIIAGYMTESGIIERTVDYLERKAGSYKNLVVYLALLAGFISTFLDNVLVILLLGELILEVSERHRGDPLPALFLVALSANFMGTALLLGDIPPQLLHAVAGYEFLDFIIFKGRPSSFPLLSLTFIIVVFLYTKLFIKDEREKYEPPIMKEEKKYNSFLTFSTLLIFLGTVVGMALRPRLGVPLGFISLAGASLLAAIIEIYRRVTKDEEIPSFEHICFKRIEWRAVLFYISLFIVTGGLNYSGALNKVALLLGSSWTKSKITSFTTFYWFSAGLSTIIEHDTIVLALLYMAKDFAKLYSLQAWPLYWGIAWGATLASNLTAAAAPALYVAFSLAEQRGHKIRPSRFLKYSSFFVITSLIVQYILSLLLFVY